MADKGAYVEPKSDQVIDPASFSTKSVANGKTKEN
jgi:hypothetical protein